MRLTNDMRDAFVSSVINDVPKIDYDELIRSTRLKLAEAQLPPKVAAFWGNWCECGRNAVPCAAEHAKQIAELEAEHKKQEETVLTLRGKVKAVAYSVSTRKALVDVLPEFEKYLPVDDENAARSLPVVANVVADFVKAGWPKGKKAA